MKLFDYNFIKKYEHFILYSLIGFLGVSLDIISFFFFNSVLKFNIFISAAISVTLGITNNFILNTNFNYKLKDNIFRRFLLFYSIGLLGLGITEFTLLICVNFFNIDSNISKIISVVLVVFVQYNLNKYISFKKVKNV